MNCSGAVVCPRLSESACADFGIVIGGETPVCHAAHSYPISVARGAALSFSVWQEEAAAKEGEELDLSCFLFCTEDGALPAAAAARTKISPKAIDATVASLSERVAFAVASLNGEDEVSSSAVALYRVIVPFADCGEELCRAGTRFESVLGRIVAM